MGSIKNDFSIHPETNSDAEATSKNEVEGHLQNIGIFVFHKEKDINRFLHQKKQKIMEIFLMGSSFIQNLFWTRLWEERSIFENDGRPARADHEHAARLSSNRFIV